MTSYASLRSAVDSMRMGAADYIAKPFDHADMLNAVQRVIEKHADSRREGSAAPPAEQVRSSRNMLGRCAAMQRLSRHIAQALPRPLDRADPR
jgi:two-component system response regulator HydG